MSVADLLVPNPYPLNVGAISSPSVTTNNLTVNTAAQINGTLDVTGNTTLAPTTIATTSPFIGPLTLDSPAGALGSGLRVLIGGVTYGIFSANSVTNNIDVGSPVGSTADLGLFTAGNERLRVPNAGITDDLAATAALTVGPGPEIHSIPMSSSGAFVSTWTPTIGFAPAPGVNNIQYIRVGNVVHCQFTAYAVTTAVGNNTATITLPVPRTVAFGGAIEECTGSLFANGTVSNYDVILDPVPGSMNTALLTHSGGVVQTADLRGSFSYRLSP